MAPVGAAVLDKAMISAPLARPPEHVRRRAERQPPRKKATVTISAGKMETVKLFGDESRKLLRVTTTNTALPTETRGWVDEKGNTLKSETDMGLVIMTTYVVSEEEALKAITGGDLDIVVGSLIFDQETAGILGLAFLLCVGAPVRETAAGRQCV